jgi:TPR repeat protein
MLQLARELETVVGVDDDARAAVDWFRRAAAAGSADAMFDVATLHRRGFRGIVAPDRREWLDWIERAAMAGHPRAMWYLGIELREPDLRPQDRAQAVAWFREGAERRDWRSTLFLAWCLYRGDGCIRDRVEARRWAGRLAWLLLRSWTTTLTLWLFASAMGLTVFGLVAIAVSWRLSGWAPFGLGYPDWLWPFSGR